MGLALYRKYRPKRLQDVVGQDHIIKTLTNALASGKVSHAYLFTGPRGVGKTSIARILAHEINQLPYEDDSMHLDIIEIDAASNRRIDEIRDLRDKVHIAPTSAKYKVYIIDEVHMLTREAFNALLKTLEEPPAHAVFILATTEAHKVPDTITSRTQRFTFKPISRADAVAHLRDLAKREGIDIDDEALEVLSDHAGGSFRDSINLLDQMVGTGSVGRGEVEAMLGIPSARIIDDLHAAVEAADISRITALLAQARTAGTDAATLARQLARVIREAIIEQGGAPATQKVALLKQLVHAAAERDAYAGLELALLEYVSVPAVKQHTATPQPVAVTPQPPQPAASAPHTKTPKPAAVSAPEPTSEPITEPIVEPVTESAPESAAEPTPPPESEPPQKPATPPVGDDSYWPALLAAVKQSHNTLYTVLRMAQPQLEGNKLTLAFSFGFHQKQMSTATNQKRIADAASDLLGRPIEVSSIVDKNAKASAAAHPAPSVSAPAPNVPAAAVAHSAPASHTATKPAAAPSGALKDISTFFNGAELLD